MQSGGFEKLALDSQCGDPKERKTNENVYMNNMGRVTSNPFEAVDCHQDPFYASNNVAPPTAEQLAAVGKQQDSMLHQQENKDFPMCGQIYSSKNPFVNKTVASLHRPQNSYSSMI